MLQKADRFEEEVRGRLAAYPSETVDLVVKRLRDRGILNDRRAAENFVSSRQGRKSLGSQLVTERLLGRGAPEEVVATATRQVDDRAVALELLRTQRSLTAEDRGRAGRMLIRKGIDPELVESVLDQYLEEQL